MWGGRFARGPASIMEEINASIEFDKRLASQDLAGSRAHAQMLADQGIITQADGAAIITGLDQIAAEIEGGKFAFKRELEDIHLNIESRLAGLSARQRGGCTRAVRAMIRLQPIFVFGRGLRPR